ncbi:MAG: glycine oxidase ThiO [Gemmatimonadota bacterium]
MSGAGTVGREPEAVVLGAGIAGCCVALALRALGVSVALVERNGPGGRATRASAGMLAAQYESAAGTPLFRLAVEGRLRYPAFVERLESLSGRRVGWRVRGMLVANADPAMSAEADAAAVRQREAGLRAETLPGEEAARLQPGLQTGVDSWLWLPDEAQVDARELAEALGEAVARAGVRVAAGCEAAGIAERSGRVRGVVLSDGTRFEARRVVVACGAWSGSLDGLPRPLPVRPIRGQVLRLPSPEPPVRRLVADHRGHYLVPCADGTLLAGSTMEDAGFDATTSEEGVAAILEAVAALFPAVRGARPLEEWAGLRPMAEDDLPVLGPDPEMEGLLYATGYGRNGILVAPLAGEAVARLALDREPELEWRAFRPDRFGD